MPTTPEERAAKKATKREANREAWLNSPHNAHVQWRRAEEEMRAALADPVNVQTESAPELGLDSLDRMRKIMLDAAASLARRLDAAETLSVYEVGIAGAAGLAPDEIAASSHRFLRTVLDAEEVPEVAKFRALKALVTIENRRAQARSSSDAHRQHKEFLRRRVNAVRAAELRRAGAWERVIESGAQWSLTPADQWDEPALPETPVVAAVELDGRGAGAVMHALVATRADVRDRHAAEINRLLLEVRAKNRVDDWRQLLSH